MEKQGPIIKHAVKRRWLEDKAKVKSCTSSLVLLLSLFLTACSYNPSTGTKQFNFVSDKAEVKIGRQADKQIKSEYGIYKDPELQAYVNEIGQRVAQHCGRTNIDYYFTVLDSPIINAFALPGGYIYVTRGILAQMNSEAELAFVLGHEVAHVAAKHGAQRLSQAKSIGVIFTAAQLLTDPENFNKYGSVVNQVVNLAVLGYGRQNEYEADLLGVRYAHTSQYNPISGAAFLETLKRQEHYQADILSQFYSSHPPTKERIKRVDQEIHTLGPDDMKHYQTLRNSYLNKIDGLFTGEYSNSGELKKRQYTNMQYAFRLTIPAAWKLNATFDDSLLEFKLKKAATGHLYIEKKGNNTLQNRNEKAPSNNAVAITATRDSDTYRFQFKFLLTDSAAEKDIDALLNSLSFISEKELQEKNASRLVIHTAKKKETLNDISMHYFKTKKKAEEIAAFNNLSIALPVKAGDKIKLPPLQVRN